MAETTYHLLIKTYADRTKDQHVEGPWSELIHRAMGASMVAELAWTRHGSVQGVMRNMDFYSDMFNEGMIVLVDSEKIKTFK